MQGHLNVQDFCWKSWMQSFISDVQDVRVEFPEMRGLRPLILMVRHPATVARTQQHSRENEVVVNSLLRSGMERLTLWSSVVLSPGHRRSALAECCSRARLMVTLILIQSTNTSTTVAGSPRFWTLHSKEWHSTPWIHHSTLASFIWGGYPEWPCSWVGKQHRRKECPALSRIVFAFVMDQPYQGDLKEEVFIFLAMVGTHG